MVTLSNALVPPVWHFILLHHPLPSPFPSRHTGITLIMIIAVMIMITTAKLHSFAHIQHPGDYDWLKGCLQNVSPTSSFFCSLQSLFVSFFLLSFLLCFIWLFFFLVSFLRPLTAHSLSSSPFVSLQSFSIFWQSFISVVVLLSTFPGPSYLCHLSPALSLPRSLSFSPYLFSSPSHYPSALLPAFSSPTKDQDKCAF